jgi:outer membrane protein assembly factor BamB
MQRFLLLAMLILSTVRPVDAADWAEFRGPDGTGQYTGKPIVTEWGTDKNVGWKTTIAGKGWASPIVVNGKIYLTTALPKDGGQSLHALAIDAATGKIDWDTAVFMATAKLAGRQHGKNTYASPTSVCDGKNLFVHFGHMGTACLDLKGEIVWKKTDYQYSPVHGTGGSPILVGDSLIFSVDGADKQFVVALDKKTGEKKWLTDRKSKATKTFSFTTPQLITQNGKELLISTASDFVAAYDPKTGTEIWRAKYPDGGYSLIARPILANGKLVIQTGYDTAHLFVLDPTGEGDISKNITWSTKNGAPHTPTPIAFGDEIYTVTDKGFLTCFESKTGKVNWSERLAGKGYSASPILADGKLYITSEEGVGQVIEANAKEFKELSKSELKEKTFATFAAVEGALFVRTETQLYRFEKK